MASFLVDEDMPRSLAAALASAGLRAVDGRDAGLKGRPDREVRAFAVRERMALITADLEFANPQIFPDGFPYGLILCRYPSETPPSMLCKSVAAQIAGLSQDDLTQSIVVLEHGRIRLHKRRA